MAWAFDYETAINHIFVDTTQSRGPIPKIIAGHDPTVFQYHRNLDKAMEELKQSRYYDKLEEYPVNLHWIAEVADEEKLALLFMSNMADIGIKVNPVKTPWVLYVDQTSNIDSSPHIGITYPSSVYSEAGSLLGQVYTSKTAPSQNQNEWLLDPEYDAMFEDALRTIDKDERYAKYSKLQHYIVDLCPTIYVADMISRHPFQSYYIDWWSTDEPFCPLKGYSFIMRNVKVYPEKRAELLEKK
jgi:peptide/nickel transport system substrate-binding protein